MVLAPSPRLLPTRKRTSRALRRIPAVHNVPHKLSCSWLRWRPGAFGGEVQRFHLEKRDRTVVVEKIPEDRFSPDAVHGWFERFGTVTNVAVDADSVKALVSLSTHKGAHAAWKTEDAIFGNRLFRVFWHGGPRSLRGSALSASRCLCADCHPSTVASLITRLPPLLARCQGPSEEHRPRRRMLSHHLRVVLVSNRRRSPR